MNEVIEFWEMDGGPSGIWWEAPYGLPTTAGSTAWDTTDEMLVAARQVKEQGYPVRFRTQAEYELIMAIEED